MALARVTIFFTLVKRAHVAGYHDALLVATYFVEHWIQWRRVCYHYLTYLPSFVQDMSLAKWYWNENEQDYE